MACFPDCGSGSGADPFQPHRTARCGAFGRRAQRVLRELRSPAPALVYQGARAEQGRAGRTGHGGPGFVAALLRAEVPAPAPQWPFEVTTEALCDFYRHVSDELLRFVAGLAVWDRLTDTERDRVQEAVTARLPALSIVRYEEAYRHLASQFPEFAFWANQVDHQATRHRLDELDRGLAGLERMLTRFGQEPDEHRAALTRVYRAALDQPVLTTADGPAGLRIPLLRDAYVNPDYRVAQPDIADRLAEESWWQSYEVRDDLQGFLAGHLTSRLPLLAHNKHASHGDWPYGACSSWIAGEVRRRCCE